MALHIDGSDAIDLDIMKLRTREQFIEDYRLAYRSRQMSLIGRREVLNGRAKFGAFGDGKEIPQVALARVFQKGDFRSGYYRDQTWMMALGVVTIRSFFAQLYAHADIEAEPASGGRQMISHVSTRSLDDSGNWLDLTQQYNSASDMSCTAAQIPRIVGLAYASRLYRELDELKQYQKFSKTGNEIVFGAIGNASCSEGMFWESINSIGILQVPAIISIWDDGYGISVKNDHQFINGDLTNMLEGFRRKGEGEGFNIYTVKGWNYPELVKVYEQAADDARREHIPAIIHVVELTQPQGHSTSGSHERYKSAERLQWEEDGDGIAWMRDWMLENHLISESKLTKFEQEELALVRSENKNAWNAFVDSIDAERAEAKQLIEQIANESEYKDALNAATQKMYQARFPRRMDIMEATLTALKITRNEAIVGKNELIDWRESHAEDYRARYSSHLTDEIGAWAKIAEVKPGYGQNAPEINAFELLNQYFDGLLKRDPRVIAFGEDVGYLGGVNQTMAGLQAKHGELRVSDTGIHEIAIMGRAIGMAMRGLRPIAEIQYLDYILYALQIMSDDLASLRWRTYGGQQAPVIVRTRGHRLEGIWHSGSPMGSIIHMLRGMHVLVPRDMTRAAGFYNTLIQQNDPALIVEVLNGYRKKERLPNNLDRLTVPIGIPEVLREGDDVTLVTYGALCHIALDAAEELHDLGIEVEVIDVQSLLPFDIHQQIVKSLKKTNRIVCVDEDVPGGTTAYMLQEILETQGGYHWLDAEPRTLTAKPHRPAYGTDGNYFSKPNKEDIFMTVYALMHESNPAQHPNFWKLSRNDEFGGGAE